MLACDGGNIYVGMYDVGYANKLLFFLNALCWDNTIDKHLTDSEQPRHNYDVVTCHCNLPTQMKLVVARWKLTFMFDKLDEVIVKIIVNEAKC